MLPHACVNLLSIYMTICSAIEDRIPRKVSIYQTKIEMRKLEDVDLKKKTSEADDLYPTNNRQLDQG